MIRKANKDDIETVAELYNIMIDYEDSHIKYTSWQKGIYPTAATARLGVKANTLYVDFGEDPYAYCVSIYNDGLLPTGPIREGGGLSALRKHAERIGGQMEIQSVPRFILTVTIGKGGDRDV
jgi:hypothetical protein